MESPTVVFSDWVAHSSDLLACFFVARAICFSHDDVDYLLLRRVLRVSRCIVTLSFVAAGSSGGTSINSPPLSSGPASTGSRGREETGAAEALSFAARVNETADQLSFICGILEKYLRCVSVSLLLGGEEHGSALRYVHVSMWLDGDPTHTHS